MKTSPSSHARLLFYVLLTKVCDPKSILTHTFSFLIFLSGNLNFIIMQLMLSDTLY